MQLSKFLVKEIIRKMFPMLKMHVVEKLKIK